MNPHKQLIILLLLIAIIPRALSLATFNFIDSGGGSDSVTYLLLANNLFSGRGYTLFGAPQTVRPPLYPIVIGLLNYLTGDPVRAALLASTVAGALLVIPVYLVAYEMFGRRAGFLAGLMTALFPILVYGSTESFSESLYTLLLISGMAAGWATFTAGGIRWPIYSGTFLALGFLTHPLGLSFLPLVAGFNLLAGRNRHWWKERIRSVILISGAFIIVCTPYWIYLYSVTGNWQISGHSHYKDIGLRYTQARGMAEGEIIFQHMEMYFHPDRFATCNPDYKPLSMSGLIFRHPARLIRIIRFNLLDGYQEIIKTAHYLSLSPAALLTLLFGGMLILLSYFALSFIRGRRQTAISYLILMFAPIGLFLIMIIEHRYFYIFIPLSLIAFARILDDIGKAGARKVGIRRIFTAGLVVYYLALTASSLFIVYRKVVKANVPYEYKIMGTWMRDNIPGIEEEKVMAFRLGVSYYAGSLWNVFYWGDLPGLRVYLAERGIKYLVVDRYKLHMIHPELRFLLDADPLPQSFSLVRELDFDGRKIRLIRFNAKGE